MIYLHIECVELTHLLTLLGSCPRGDDPMTGGQVNEVQILRCTARGGSFMLYFNGEGTKVPFDATDVQLQAALERIKTMPKVKVTYSVPSTLCNSVVMNAVLIEFIDEFGPYGLSNDPYRVCVATLRHRQTNGTRFGFVTTVDSRRSRSLVRAVGSRPSRTAACLWPLAAQSWREKCPSAARRNGSPAATEVSATKVQYISVCQCSQSLL